MSNNVAIKLAASTLVLGVTMVGCKPAAEMYRPASLSAKAPRADQDAVKLYAKAQEAVQQGRMSDALALAEQAVELSPRDAGYRMLLGDLYLKNGRFRSAETSFDDVLMLDPGNARASLSIALAKIALGRTAEATAYLDSLAATAQPGDLGLAYALAGQPDRAVQMLEPAARQPGADGRVRQNLALAYALAGDWLKARTTAAQDVSPARLNERMEQWAAFAKPAASWTQVAGLLGVTPVEDAGQPVRLALAPEAAPADVRMAEATEPTTVADPVEIAYAPPPEVENAVVAAPVPVAAPEPDYAEAVRTLVDPRPAVIRASQPIAETPVPAFVPAAKAPRIAGRAEATRAGLGAKPNRFVVQLGAFSTPANVERAWVLAMKRYPKAAERVPLSTTVSIPGKGTFHRLSVSGFGTRGEAIGLCSTVRAKGGTCFVRETAGDAPTRWASRYTRGA